MKIGGPIGGAAQVPRIDHPRRTGVNQAVALVQNRRAPIAMSPQAVDRNHIVKTQGGAQGANPGSKPMAKGTAPPQARRLVQQMGAISCTGEGFPPYPQQNHHDPYDLFRSHSYTSTGPVLVAARASNKIGLLTPQVKAA